MTKTRTLLTGLIVLLLAASAGCTSRSTLERVYPKNKHSIESRVFVGELRVTFATVERSFSDKDTIPLCIQIKNMSDEVITLNYASGQRYDFAIVNSAGEQIWQWEAGRNFALVSTAVDLKVGQRQTFCENLAPGFLKPGTYTIEGKSMADELYSETLELKIYVKQ